MNTEYDPTPKGDSYQDMYPVEVEHSGDDDFTDEMDMAEARIEQEEQNFINSFSE